MSIIGEATWDAFKAQMLEKIDKEIETLRQDPEAITNSPLYQRELTVWLKCRQLILEMYY